MKIDGRLIAQNLKKKLQLSISHLSASPHLAVVIAGKDPSSLTYVGQKLKIGKEIGAQVTIFRFPNTVSATEVFALIEKLNEDSTINGIIIQRPLPIDIDKEKLNRIVIASKDVDGFHPEGKFTPPVTCAIMKILQWVHQDIKNKKQIPDFSPWLKNQSIIVIGRGETAGRPIAKYLIQNNFPVTIAHSKSENMKELCLQANIIISCVGEGSVVRHSARSPHNGSWIVRLHMVTNKTILIGVGMHSVNGKLVADYNQEEISPKVAYYTPVPGGVGPVNVACLFENLTKAYQINREN